MKNLPFEKPDFWSLVDSLHRDMTEKGEAPDPPDNPAEALQVVSAQAEAECERLKAKSEAEGAVDGLELLGAMLRIGCTLRNAFDSLHGDAMGIYSRKN